MPKKIGLDLGTDNIRMITDDGKIFRAPSVIVMDKYAEKIAAVGVEARRMLGKTPDHMEAIRPIKNGVIANGTACSDMLRSFLEQINAGGMANRTEVVVSIPGGITEMEVSNIRQAVFEAGARKVTLVDASICAAIGAGLQYRDVRGSMIMDLGGGLSRAAVISLGDIARFEFIQACGDQMDADIAEYVRIQKHVSIGEQTAEFVKRKVGSAHGSVQRGTIQVIGREEQSRKIGGAEVSSDDVRRAVNRHVEAIAGLVRKTLSSTPPELCADIGDFGIMLTGGLACMPGLPQAIAERVRIRVTLARNPMDVTINGLGLLIQGGGETRYAK